MNWLELPWVLVPLWAVVLFLDFLYVADLGPRIVIRALRAVFGRYAVHALIYAPLFFFSYLLFIESVVFGPMPGVSEFWDPFFLVSFILLSPLLLSVETLTVLSYAGVGASVGWAFVGGLLAAACTGEVTERERKDMLRDEIFSSDNPDQFLDELIARAYADQANIGMKQTLSDLKGMVPVCDTKGATIRKAFERYERHKDAPRQNQSEVGSLSQMA